MNKHDSSLFELEFSSVSRSFGERRVLEAVTATARTGQVMVISGPNGSGKSTLVKIAARLMRPSSGKAACRLGGVNIDAGAWRRCIGLVSPDLTLYDELSAEENLMFFSQVRGHGASREAISGILTRFQLDGRGADLVGSYSSGMKQRLKYAYALLHDPPLLLLDEPTANLDARGVALIHSVIESLRPSKCIAIATNEPEEVQLGDLVISLGS
ncbi:MAG: ATP-binding cassette domain-containing protein [Clostridia bacterium]|nr:ATP-binding cassette domain-containing protein [Clostridia bacterium]